MNTYKNSMLYALLIISSTTSCFNNKSFDDQWQRNHELLQRYTKQQQERREATRNKHVLEVQFAKENVDSARRNRRDDRICSAAVIALCAAFAALGKTENIETCGVVGLVVSGVITLALERSNRSHIHESEKHLRHVQADFVKWDQENSEK